MIVLYPKIANKHM